MHLFKKIISEIKNEPLVLSHHPLCGEFEDHFLIIRGKKVCRGCITVYPSALISILIFIALNLLSFEFLFFASLVCFIINCYRFVIGENVQARFLMNIILGFSLGSVILSVLFAPASIFIPWLAFVIVVASLFMFIKGWNVYSKCKKCFSFANFPRCAVKVRLINIEDK